jgi:hypothetical protein
MNLLGHFKFATKHGGNEGMNTSKVKKEELKFTLKMSVFLLAFLCAFVA